MLDIQLEGGSDPWGVPTIHNPLVEGGCRLNGPLLPARPWEGLATWSSCLGLFCPENNKVFYDFDLFKLVRGVYRTFLSIS